VDGLWATKGEGVGIIDRAIVSKISNLCDPDPPTSQMDRRTTCNLNTALCTSASHGNKGTWAYVRVSSVCPNFLPLLSQELSIIYELQIVYAHSYLSIGTNAH